MRSRLLGAGLVSAALLAPTAAYTYSLLNPPRHWPSIPVSVCVSKTGHKPVADKDGGVSATIDALNNTLSLLAGTGWNAGRAVGVVRAIPCTTPWVLGDGNPTIAFDEKIPGTCGGSCLAATFVGYYACDPTLADGHCTIVDSDVETRRNKSDRYGGPYYSLYEPCRSGKEWNIEAIMVHEVGHVLGLGHSNVSGATMYPSVPSCNANPATIETDDATGLGRLYPPS